MRDAQLHRESFRLTGGSAPIDGVFHWRQAREDVARPTVVICHGFKGFMSWGFFPSLANLLAARGFGVVRFNYSGSGQAPGDDRVSDLDAFRQNTHGLERVETLAVIDALGGVIGAGRVDPDRVGLVGHSRGGGAALLAAAEPSMASRVRALVTWASVGTFDRYDDDAKARWRRDEGWTIVNGRTGQSLVMGLDLLNEIDAESRDGGTLDLEAAAARYTAPWLIVHGSDDEAVAVDDAHRLAAASNDAKLHIIEGAGHTFGARHPFVGPTPDLVRVMNATQTWLRQHLT